MDTDNKKGRISGWIPDIKKRLDAGYQTLIKLAIFFILERKRREKKRGKKGTTIFDIFDPYELAKGHYTDTDQEIRTTDIPERMQLRTVSY